MARLDRAKLTSGMVLALTACSTTGGGNATTGGGHGASMGHGGTSGTTTSTGTTTSSTVATSTTGVTTGVTTGSSGSGGSGGALPAGCNPAPDPSTFWAQAAHSYPTYEDTTLCPYVGQVLLVVNTAAA